MYNKDIQSIDWVRFDDAIQIRNASHTNCYAGNKLQLLVISVLSSIRVFRARRSIQQKT